jgi:hypothetical protein
MNDEYPAGSKMGIEVDVGSYFGIPFVVDRERWMPNMRDIAES